MPTRIELKNPRRAVTVNESAEEVQGKLNEAAGKDGEAFVRFEGRKGDIVVKANDVQVVATVADKPKPR
ncbi:MAG TPA: hypothetical protein VF715_02560 [Thermoleophilaceae bacterium]|jgi:hypothetical protein